MGQMTAELKIVNKKCNFLSKINEDTNPYLRLFDIDKVELISLELQHGIGIKVDKKSSDTWLSTINWKFYLWKYFQTSLDVLM